ncbi:hypothetical protein HPB49_011851 [Dermacentor silvarum]|uniref:Uncharacterized protein n=1 Tax=Dermacentor silvarum TaxID=543639 RepID=A0ACB8D5B1_DERSI|nr:hypothetical protein HPB49_011851 [Dermacentor silvarum]
MLRNLATSEQRRLLDCYNNIWWSGQVPEAWRTAIVAPILKSNKPANELSSYRPVSLTSAACKVMEAIALARLEWVARACGFLADQQTGFRRRRCTADSIADVVSTLEDARASGDLAMLLLIDVKGAFDGLPHAVVQQALDLLGIGGNLRRFLSSFLNDRTLRVRVGHARSTPQGSVRRLWAGRGRSALFVRRCRNALVPRLAVLREAQPAVLWSSACVRAAAVNGGATAFGELSSDRIPASRNEFFLGGAPLLVFFEHFFFFLFSPLLTAGVPLHEATVRCGCTRILSGCRLSQLET